VRTIDARANRLFIVLTGFFLTNAIIGEFVGVKIFALEATLGAAPFNWSLFGITGTLNFTAGVIVWPFVFILTDIINEYYGVRGVRLISWIAVGACTAWPGSIQRRTASFLSPLICGTRPPYETHLPASPPRMSSSAHGCASPPRQKMSASTEA